MGNFTLVYDMSCMVFSDDSKESWIMAMPKGRFTHPEYGELNFDDDFIKEVCDGVNNNVRGQQLDIDYDHKEKTDKAAGWVKQAEVKEDGLYILVQWTPAAYDMIKNNEYRYFSPEYNTQWKHPVTGVVHRNVLFGGGITNRPFLKGIKPLNLSEIEQKEEGGYMTPEEFGQLVELLKLDPSSTVEQVLDAIKQMLDGKDKEDKPEGGDGKPAPQMGDGQQYSENKHFRALQEMLESQANELHEARVNGIIAKFSEGNGKVAVGNPAIDSIRSLLSTNKSKAFAEQVSAVVDSLIGKGGLVDLSEVGASSTEDVSKKESTKLSERIDELVKDGMSYSDAAVQAIEEMPDSYDDMIGGN